MQMPPAVSKTGFPGFPLPDEAERAATRVARRSATGGGLHADLGEPARILERFLDHEGAGGAQPLWLPVVAAHEDEVSRERQLNVSGSGIICI